MYGSTETQRAVGYIEVRAPPVSLPRPAHPARPMRRVRVQIEGEAIVEDAADVPGLAPPMARMKEVIPVGVGMCDVQVLPINSAGLLGGVGELAELYVRSPHIAKGYLVGCAYCAREDAPWPTRRGRRASLRRRQPSSCPTRLRARSARRTTVSRSARV